jgi:hypothetical protein
MAFIKIQNVVINIRYVTGIKLSKQTVSGEKRLSVLIANTQFTLHQWDTIAQNLYYCEGIEFTGQPANTFQDFFTSFNNVINLLPQYLVSFVLAQPLVEKSLRQEKTALHNIFRDRCVPMPINLGLNKGSMCRVC